MPHSGCTSRCGAPRCRWWSPPLWWRSASDRWGRGNFCRNDAAMKNKEQSEQWNLSENVQINEFVMQNFYITLHYNTMNMSSVPPGPLQIQTICTAFHLELPNPPVYQQMTTLSQLLVCASEKKPQIRQRPNQQWQHHITGITHYTWVYYLRFWLRQKIFWYCKMVQFILVWVCKPAWIKIPSIVAQ